MNILIADDHDLFRDAFAALLRERYGDINISLVANLGVALYAVKSKPKFDVILLDLCMPGMNGLRGAEELISKVGDTPVVLMSGSQRVEIINKARTVGLKGFISKTLSGASLMSALNLIMSGETFFSHTEKLRTIGHSANSLTLPDWSPA